MKEYRADRSGPHRVAFEKNKKIILKTKNVCGICGRPVDKSLKYPHPLSPVTVRREYQHFLSTFLTFFKKFLQ